MTRFANIDLLKPLDDLAPGGRIGLIALATDFNIECDLKSLYPDDVAFFTSRVRNHNPLTIENLRRMAPDISEAADRILPGTDLDAIIFACTSGAVAIGTDEITRLIQDVRPGAPVINPATAAVTAFKALGAKKISVLTAYTEVVNRDVAKLFDDYGFDVINIAGFGFEDDTAATFITPDDIERAAIETFDQRSDLLFISCTALRASSRIEVLETKVNVPVLCSNQVLAWQSLHVMNYPLPVQGFGSLMRDHLGSSSLPELKVIP
ncbi:aspartate/glutamate racemase family protein [Thalassospira australica]|uniref:maleate cis-trans isomerase family protein n=1 Tax=Thalassospira australica TaxID=1528106 RepID=UPI00068AB5D8|nr:aspartate/glutamate racemase family protein [Thalassospira australica]